MNIQDRVSMVRELRVVLTGVTRSLEVVAKSPEIGEAEKMFLQNCIEGLINIGNDLNDAIQNGVSQLITERKEFNEKAATLREQSKEDMSP